MSFFASVVAGSSHDKGGFFQCLLIANWLYPITVVLSIKGSTMLRHFHFLGVLKYLPATRKKAVTLASPLLFYTYCEPQVSVRGEVYINRDRFSFCLEDP